MQAISETAETANSEVASPVEPPSPSITERLRVDSTSTWAFLRDGLIDRVEAWGDRQKADLRRADRAQASLNNLAMVAVSLIVALTVGAIVAAFLLPIAIDELVAVETTDWGDAADAMWGILDAIIVLAAFLFFVAVALGAADRV